MSDRLYRKTAGGTWYGWFYGPDGRRRQICTRTRRRTLAVRVLRDREREAFSSSVTRRGESVEDALHAFLRGVRSRVAPATLTMYRQKCGHLLRLLGARAITDYCWDWSLEYIEQREAEGAHGHTIKKELSALRGTLRTAMARETLRPVPIETLVPSYRARYVPRKTFPSVEALDALLGQLAPERRPWVLLAAYAGLRASEVERVEWGKHLRIDSEWLIVEGTKTPGSHRRVPLSPVLVEAFASQSRASGRVVEPWTNVRRDLAQACRRAGIPRYSPNDLRRAYGSWLRSAGVPPDLIARFLGHSSTRLVESTYGHFDDSVQLRAIHLLPRPASVDQHFPALLLRGTSES